MKKTVFLLLAALLVVNGGICRADATADLAKENASLKKRVDRLEKELRNKLSLLVTELLFGLTALRMVRN